jgi:hypothetical protein
MLEKDLKSHWNGVYEKSPIDKLGWYEEEPEPSLSLINKYISDKEARILNVGSGASTLIDKLLEVNYQNIIANDLSAIALDKLKKRLAHNESNIHWVVDDLTQPSELIKLKGIDLWHDRAVLHFFNDEKDQASYFKLVRNLVKVNGIVIIAAFNLDGAPKCSGLPVFRYNAEMLQSRLGKDFEPIESFNHTYTMPAGDTREYVYAVFKRTK